jgi:23S rRNA maturation-related 3'-5' exoribonuclease YhaM
MTDWDNDILGKAETDETIIDLMDIVGEEPDPEPEDDIIELTDIVDENISDPDPEIVRFEPDAPHTAEPVPDQSAALSAEQIEAALERVIEKKIAEKIEPILFEVLERVIEKEIAEIRASLQKDLDQIGTV